MLKFSFEYRKLGDFVYHVLSAPTDIKAYLMKWIMQEWALDHAEAPQEHWTVAWMNVLPKMEFRLEIILLDDIFLNTDLMSAAGFRASLAERAAEREEAVLRGVSIEPLLMNRSGAELMDGYTRYTLLKSYEQKEVYAYVGTVIR